MVIPTRYTASYDGVTAGEGESLNNVVIYIPSLSANITPDVLTIENIISTTDTFDYKLTIEGAVGSAEAFSKSLLFAVDGYVSNATGIAGTDVRFIGNFNRVQTDFFTYFSTLPTAKDLSTTFITGSDSIFPSGKNVNVTIGKEYVGLIAYLFSGNSLFTDAFNNSKTVREKIDGNSTTTGSIIHAIDGVFNSIAETTLSDYTAINASPTTHLGAKSALTAFTAMTTYAEDRFNTTNSDGSPALTQVLNNLPTNIGTNENVYRMPFLPGDIIQWGVTLNIPATQFAVTIPTITPNSTVLRTSYKVLMEHVLA